MKENKISQTGETVGASLQFPPEPCCRILLADDYKPIRQLIPEVLVHSGYEVDTVADGAAAWEALQMKPFNLLITDNEMPGLSGVELVRKLRSARMTLPVILTSGSLFTEDLAQNPSLQLSAMLPKPFSPDELLGTVTNVLTATVSGNAGRDGRGHAQTGPRQPAGDGRAVDQVRQERGQMDTAVLPRRCGQPDAAATVRAGLQSGQLSVAGGAAGRVVPLHSSVYRAPETACSGRRMNGHSQHPSAIVEAGAIIGSGTKIWAFVHILPGAVIGVDCNICDQTFIEGKVRIGNRVTVKCGVSLWDGLVVENDVFIGPNAVFTNDLRPRSQVHLKSYPQTRLKEGSTLGANCVILPGLTIGRWAMVGAGAVVTHDVPDFGLVVGTPARLRGWVCRCGKKLTSPVPSRWICSCGRIYEEEGEGMLRESLLGLMVGCEKGIQIGARL